MTTKFRLKPRSFCVDIGCNDGTLLTGFKRLGMRTLGVEPTNMAKFARQENKLEVIQDFFREAVADQVVAECGKAAFVSMTNVFAHIGALGEVMRGLTKLLDTRGVFMTESQYLLDILERNQFDQVYHEHIRLYSVRSLVALFRYYGMEVFDAERLPSREGSIRVYAGWKGKHPIRPTVAALLKEEERKELFNPSTWADWRNRIVQCRDEFLSLAHRCKEMGLRFVADSCPGRGAVLVNYYGLDKTLLPYIAQLPGSEKIGRFLPGTHIPIVDNGIILKEQPDYVVVLAWHYGDFIMKNWRKKGLRSKFVMPLPKFRVV